MTRGYYSQLNLGSFGGAFGASSASNSTPSPAILDSNTSLTTTVVDTPSNQQDAIPLLNQQTCPVCFDCRRSGCTNFGSCEANAACSCHDGWGFQDCSKPLCGGLSIYNTSRPVSNGTSACRCEKGWEGPNCNVCSGKFYFYKCSRIIFQVFSNLIEIS